MILHITTSLDNGGAQSLLVAMVKTDSEEEHAVISLSHLGFYGAELQESGIPVHTLDMPRSRVTISGLIKLFRLIRFYDARVIQTWMYHANFLGGLIARLAGKNRVVWGLHNSVMDPAGSSLSVRICDRLSAILSGTVPRKIVHCSESGAADHIEKGYNRSRLEVIYNGYNLDRYKPDKNAGLRLREDFGVPPETMVVGMVARFDPQKDHGNMLRAIALMPVNARSHCLFMLVGDGMESSNHELLALIEEAGVGEHLKLLGPRRDVPDLMSLFDIHVLSSAFGESFPNVVNEAMACGVPCIVTDSGDSAMIVGDTGWVVSPKDPPALSAAITHAAAQIGSAEWEQRKRNCRQRVLDNFTLDKMIRNYRRVWADLH